MTLRSIGSLGMTALVLCGLAASATPTTAQLQPRPTREPIITRINPRFDRLVPVDARLEKIVDDHGWAEGPVWVRDGGYLLFSDVVKNRIYKWKEREGEGVALDSSGYTGGTPFTGA